MDLEFYAWRQKVVLPGVRLGLGLGGGRGELGFEELSVRLGNSLVLLCEFERYTSLPCEFVQLLLQRLSLLAAALGTVSGFVTMFVANLTVQPSQAEHPIGTYPLLVLLKLYHPDFMK